MNQRKFKKKHKDFYNSIMADPNRDLYLSVLFKRENYHVNRNDKKKNAATRESGWAGQKRHCT